MSWRRQVFERRAALGIALLATAFVYAAGVIECAKHIGNRPALWIVGGIALGVFWMGYFDARHERCVNALRELDHEWREHVASLLETKEES